MAQSLSRAYRLVMAVAVLGGAALSVVGASPAAANVTAVTGSACGYFTDVSLFGGPKNLRGCGQPGSAPANNASPSVTLPAGGSASPVTGTDADGAQADYGPAKIFSGQYPSNDTNATSPPSGPLNVSTQGTTGPGGSVTSSASITQGSQPPPGLPSQPRGVGPGPIVADAISSTCTAKETDPATGAKSVTASTAVTNGIVVLSTDANGDALTSEPVPANPPVNYTRSGVITNVGDNFTAIYNEQIIGADGSITVNAVHLKLLGPTAVGDLIIAQSVCGVTTVASGTTTTTGGGSTTTTLGGTTTTTVASTTTTQATTTTTAATTTTVGADTTTTTVPTGEVSGGACGYFTDVSLFGGPKNLRGCGQPSSAPATNASPSVTLPAGGSATPITATDADGAVAEYGPAKIFSGQYPADPNADAPPSGPITVSTQGTPGGTVTSSAAITLPRGVGPGPIVADGVRSTCTAGPSGVSGTTTITGGKLVTSTTADGSALDSEPVPANPPVNYTRTGVITNVGDNFRVVYNEQITNANGSITVNAVHMSLLGPTAVGDLVIAQSRCGRTAAASGGGGTTSAASTGGVARTGANILRSVAFAMVLVALGAHIRHAASQLAWTEPEPGTGFRRRRWPRRATPHRRLPVKRPWD